MVNLEKAVIDGETLYINHDTGKTLVKLSKEEFRAKMLRQRTNEQKRIDAVNKRALEQWNEERQQQHDRDNSHIKKAGSGGGVGNTMRDSLLAKFGSNLDDAEVNYIEIGRTSLGLDYNGEHFELKVTKKNQPIEEFVDKPAKPDQEKHEIFGIVLEGVGEATVVIKNDIFLRAADSDFQIKITKRRSAIEGL